MNERTHNIIVGITAILGLVILCVLLSLFGYLPGFLESGYHLRIEMPDAGGLTPGSRVTYQGIDIGSVQKVAFDADDGQGVYAVALIEDDVNLPANVIASISSAAMFGSGPSVILDPPADLPPDSTALAKDGSAVIIGRVLSLSDQLFGQFDKVLAEPMQQLERLVDNFEQISGTWNEVGENIVQLTEPRALGDVDAQNPGNLATVVARMDRRLAELEAVLSNANDAMAGIAQWTNDATLREDIAATASNARKLTANLDERTSEMAEQYVEVADNLSAAIAEMRLTLKAARTGEGTVGKLLNDPALYDNLNDAAERLNLVLAEVNRLLEKLKKEGLPVKLGE